MKQIERYDVFELRIRGPKPVASDVNVDFYALFRKGDKAHEIKGFYNGNHEYVVRFMPSELGVWHYETILNGSEEKSICGDFECIKESGSNHGPVVVNGMAFQYADGTKFIPVGTTIYAWIHQPEALIQKTIDTLSKNPFNKVRMCVFPKGMMYNNNEPELYAFEKKEDGKWDVNKPNFEFWSHLEKQLMALQDLRIEADLILFHPYDRWGFAELDRKENLTYLDYCVRRLSAFRNIWWSLANEYDLVFSKKEDDWNAFGEFIYSEDAYHHLLSNHNWLRQYDASKPWITHSSIQTRQYERTKEIRDKYQKPVMIDECRYEGDIEIQWGNISAFEMVHRFWAVMVLGGYCTHGETFYNKDEVLWWSKGGELHGQSAARISFLRDIMYGLDGEIQPVQGMFEGNPNDSNFAKLIDAKNNPFAEAIRSLEPQLYDQLKLEMTAWAGRHDDKYIIHYLGRECRAFLDLLLPEEGQGYSVDVIDIWEMTRENLIADARGKTRVKLPGKEGIAVIATQN